MQQYTSVANVEAIKAVALKFLREKYSITIAENDAVALIRRISAELLNYYADAPAPPDISLFNKHVIGKLKDAVLQAHAAAAAQRSAATNALPQAAPAPAPLPQPLPQPQPQPPQTAAPESQMQTEEFFEKLEKFELQRSLTLPGATNATENLVVAPAPTAALVASAPPQSAHAQSHAASAPSIFYVSAPSATAAAIPVIINGLERDWEYFTDRSTLVWTGVPRPEGSTGTQIRLSCIALPKIVATKTPFVVIKINGAGNHSLEIVCSCTPSHSQAHAPPVHWDIWKPCSAEMSIIKQIATPWTILITDTYKNHIDIGNDGAVVTVCDKTLVDGYVCIQLSSCASINITANNELLFKRGTAESYKFRVLQVSNKIITLDTKTDANLKDMTVCNLSLQISVILEIIKNEK